MCISSIAIVQELAQQLPGVVPCDSFERWLITILLGALIGGVTGRALPGPRANGGGK